MKDCSPYVIFKEATSTELAQLKCRTERHFNWVLQQTFLNQKEIIVIFLINLNFDIFRFVQQCTYVKNIISGPLLVAGLKDSKSHPIKRVQHICFADNIKNLNNHSGPSVLVDQLSQSFWMLKIINKTLSRLPMQNLF